nr:enhancer of polycomb homolog 1-like [Paramormyrops kingsleyae]
MSKLSFRARALDASKPLPVFRCEDLPDLHEYASINRAVPQMPTGMEKEEESEHHLQRAISAQQVYGEKRDSMVIPVPEAESNIAYYDTLYPGEFRMPKQLIHIQREYSTVRPRVRAPGLPATKVLLDRAHSDLDHVFHALDPDATPLTPQPLDDTIASTSETNTSDRAAPGGRQQVLLNIKSCRWRYFRPRTARRGGADGGDPSGAGRAPASGPGSQARTGPGAAPVAAFTMEQYQQHQEQLALMQRQQLEQTQLQLQQASAEPPGSNTQGSTSKTLDSASAQFAVSALVTTEQLLAAKAKDETALGLGVNGVLPGSGVYKTSHHASGSPAPVAPTGQPAAVAVATTTTTMMAGPTFHQPPANNGTTVTPSSAAATQVLIGNNIRLSVPPPGGALSPIATLNARHISRTINAVPPSALKLAAAAGNCQMPKVTAASSLDMAPRENHDQEKTTLNSISDNTVAMEVT